MAKKPKTNGSVAPSSPVAQRSRLRRTLFTAGLFAFLAMVVVPCRRGGYFPIIETDTEINISHLVLNVTFAALAGALVANMSKRVGLWTGGSVAFLAAAGFTYHAWEKEAFEACYRAERDERYADKLISDAGRWQTSAGYPAQEVARQVAAFRALAKEKRLLAADNWNIALDFVKEKRARALAGYVSTDPNFGLEEPNAEPPSDSWQRFPRAQPVISPANPYDQFDELVPARTATPQKPASKYEALFSAKPEVPTRTASPQKP